MRTALLKRLARLLLKVGGWVLKAIARRGRKDLVAYLEVRADLLDARRRRARAALRKEWLALRVRAWRALAKFLREHDALDDALDDAAARAASLVDRVPESVDQEDYRRWRRGRR